MPGFLASVSCLRRHITTRCASARGSAKSPETKANPLFRYTSGRWLYNEQKRLNERYLEFDLSALAKVAAASVGRVETDIESIKKLAEGGSNRTFKISMRDGFQMVARLPYPSTQPQYLAVASEVATMKLVRARGIPVPNIYGYSPHAANSVGDTWFTLSESQMVKVLEGLVEIEAKLFQIEFPAYGSIYFDKDLSREFARQPTQSLGCEDYCIGPDASLRFWYQQRSALNIKRGPSSTPVEVLKQAAMKEATWVQQYGRPRFPYDRISRDITNYAKSDPQEHLTSLGMYMKVCPQLVPEEKWLHRPILRHPDLNLNNIFISHSYEISGIIDWQHSQILPLFVSAEIPEYFQNYGDPVSDSLSKPCLDGGFGQMDPDDQAKEIELHRRRLAHYYYVAATAAKLDTVFDALMYEGTAFRRKIYRHAGEPWEGNNIPLKADLVLLQRHWKELACQASDSQVLPPCPLSFDDQDTATILDAIARQEEADENMTILRGIMKIGSDGWVSHENYDAAKVEAAVTKKQALEDAEDEAEREMTLRHWPFDDHDEDE